MTDSQDTQLSHLLQGLQEDQLAAHLDWLGNVRRDTGGVGEAKTVAYIVEKLRQAGMEPLVHEFAAYLSYPRHAVIEVLGPEPRVIPCITHSFAKSTGSNGFVGDVHFLADKDMRKAAGRIALIEGLAVPADVLKASQAGVQALVVVNPDRYLHNMVVTTIWGGAPTPEQVDLLPSIPVVSMGKEDGEWLKAQLGDATVEVKITTQVDTGWQKVLLPEVRIPGANQEGDFVLVGSHYCSWDVGVTDNGTGVASLIEMAKRLHVNPTPLAREVRIAWWPGHTQGRYAGSTWYADHFFQDLSDNCVAYHNIDSPGQKGSTRFLSRYTTPEMEPLARRIIEGHTEETDPKILRPGRAADMSFLANGISSCTPTSTYDSNHPDLRSWIGTTGGAWWWHTDRDTRDKADTAVLLTDTSLSLALIHELATAEIYPFDFRVLAQTIRQFAVDAATAAGGLVKMDGVVEAANRLVQATAALADLIQSGRRSNSDVNRLLKSVARTLIPLMFTAEGRYTHEVAGVLQSKGKYPAALFPGLNPVFRLESIESEDERQFLATKLVRQANRFCSELVRAIDLISSFVGSDTSPD